MRCPGQDTRFWKPDAIFEVKCPGCGQAIEFFKDESKRRCKHCGHEMLNPRMDFGCAAYCRFARECLGDPDRVTHKDDLLKSRVAVAMKSYFQKDFRRIGHATKVARYAERIARQTGADMAVVLSAAYLHDIGIKEAERKYNSTDARYQEEEGPPIARNILAGCGASQELIDEVADIVGHHHHPRAEETANFKAVYDADLITNLEEEETGETARGKEKISAIIDRAFLTESGRELARSILL
ncbi:MAG: HD domain-containing protein [bacterium]